MKRTILGLGLAAMTAVALIAACGPLPENTDGGGNTCTSDSQCGSGKMCHPVSKQCVATCTGGADCPSTAKTCDVFPGSSSTAKFCQCSTDALCNGGSTGTLVCSGATKTCEAKCTATSGCPSGYSCDTASGQCSKSGGTDGGTTDGGTGVSCTWNSCTGAGEVCDLLPASGPVCVQQGSCNSANAQPDTCPWAQYCASNNKCYEPVKATCVNFAPPGGATPTFYTAGDNGPIIYDIEDLAHDDLTMCGAGVNAFSFLVHAYRSDMAWPASKFAVSGFFYVLTDGTKLDATANTKHPSGYTVTGANATFKVTLCAPAVSSNLSAGFYFKNGNEFCVTGATPNQP